MTISQTHKRASVLAAWFWRAGSVTFGVALVLAGALAVFFSSNEAGTATLLGAGVALIVLGAFGDRIKIFKAGGVELTLGEVTRKLTEADIAEKRGEDELARTLREEALRLVSAADPLASEYERLRTEMPSGGQRTSAMQTVVDDGHKLAKRPTLSQGDLRKLFDEGTDGKRITALAILQRRPDLASFELLREAIAAPRSAFEQFQTLLAVRAAIEGHGLTEREINRLRGQIRDQFAGEKLAGTDRARIAGLILNAADD